VAAGLLVRFGPLGLPRFAVKYGGSMLWALAIYWVVSALLPGRGALSVAFLAGALATSVELFKLFRSPWLDAFRLTFAGGLLLGRVFSVWDIAAYWLAAAIGAVLNLWIWRRFPSRRRWKAADASRRCWRLILPWFHSGQIRLNSRAVRRGRV
jgi:hypothetical protein